MRGRFEHDPNMIRAWSDHELVISHPPVRGGYISCFEDAFCIENYNISRSGYLPRFHRILRLPRKVTLQDHQILHLPRKMMRIIDCRDICNVIYNARSNRHHPPTSPNAAPATQNDSHHLSSWHMKRYLQCAEQQASPSKFTKCCACHVKWLSWLMSATYETSFPMRGATGITLQPHQILRLPRKSALQNLSEILRERLKRQFQCAADSTMIRAWSEHDPTMNSSSRTRPFAEVTFRASETHFVLKITTFRAPAIYPDFTEYCACHKNWHSDITKYCACHEKWRSDITKCCACHEKWLSDMTKYCACHEKWDCYWTVTELSCYWAVTKLLLSCYWTVTEPLLNWYWTVTELLLNWPVTELLLSCYWTVTELNCYWTVTQLLLNWPVTELLLNWAVTQLLLDCYWTVTELTCYWAVTELLLNWYWTVTELSLNWAVTELLLNWTVTGLSLTCYWTDLLLNCYWTDLLLNWAVTQLILDCYWTVPELLLNWPVTQLLLNCYFALLLELLLYWTLCIFKSP